MNEQDRLHLHKQLCDQVADLYRRKNADYGDVFHQTFQEEGLAMVRIRLGDKFSRFKNLSQSDSQQVQDESIEDTLFDLANYALMTIVELRAMKQ